MNQRDTCQLFVKWIDDELTDSQRSLFVAHLVTCPECQRRAEQWKDLECEIIAAIGLFGSAVPAEQNVDNFVSPHKPALRRGTGSHGAAGSQLLRRPAALTALVASLFFVAMACWAVTGTQRHEPVAEKTQRDNADKIASARVLPERIPAVSAVRVSILEPVIATAPVTTPRFTVVNVYPAFNFDQSGNDN